MRIQHYFYNIPAKNAYLKDNYEVHERHAHHHLWSGKCTLKPQWDITSFKWEWPFLEKSETSIGKGVDWKTLPFTVGKNADWLRPYGEQ